MIDLTLAAALVEHEVCATADTHTRTPPHRASTALPALHMARVARSPLGTDLHARIPHDPAIGVPGTLRANPATRARRAVGLWPACRPAYTASLPASDHGRLAWQVAQSVVSFLMVLRLEVLS